VKQFDFVATAEAADALWIRFKHRAIGDEGDMCSAFRCAAGSFDQSRRQMMTRYRSLRYVGLERDTLNA
jgi:hypothetical protein